jgi:DNA-binding GntR family transcriptional regulator
LRTPDAPVSAIGIARAVSRAIERGVYAPGDRLREQALADHFACSRAPVREALRILESQGAVVIEPMKGARISAADDASFREVFLIRRALAGMMAQRAALCGPSAKREDFLAAARDVALRADGPAEPFAAAVRAAIRAFSEAADAPRTVQIVRSLTFGHEAFVGAIFKSAAERRRTADCWGRLAQAVGNGDDQAARAQMEQLFDYAFDSVEQLVNSGGGERAPRLQSKRRA